MELPEKWWIYSNNVEEDNVIVDYFNKTYNLKIQKGLYCKGWSYSNTLNKVNGDIKIGIEIGIKGIGQQITFTQFKKHILMEKKVIGYKMIKPEYEQAAIKIIGFSNRGHTPFQKFMSTSNGNFAEMLKTAGVLNLWFDPIYEKQEERYKIRDFVLLSNTANGWGSGKEINNQIVQIIAFNINSCDDVIIHFILHGKKESTILTEIVKKVERKDVFSPGDYLFIIKDTKGNTSKSEVVKITDISPNYKDMWINHTPRGFTGGGFRWGGLGYKFEEHFRRATKKEIEEFENPLSEVKNFLSNMSNEIDKLQKKLNNE